MPQDPLKWQCNQWAFFNEMIVVTNWMKMEMGKHACMACMHLCMRVRSSQCHCVDEHVLVYLNHCIYALKQEFNLGPLWVMRCTKCQLLLVWILPFYQMYSTKQLWSLRLFLILLVKHVQKNKTNRILSIHMTYDDDHHHCLDYHYKFYKIVFWIW